jgi:hypothetical protein
MLREPFLLLVAANSDGALEAPVAGKTIMS